MLHTGAVSPARHGAGGGGAATQKSGEAVCIKKKSKRLVDVK